MVAASIGGEIIAVPYAVYHMGVYMSVVCLIVVSLLSHLSNMMYIKIKDVCPAHFESVFELAYQLAGKPALYFVCFIQYVLNFGTIILYFVIIGDTSSALMASFFVSEDASKSQDLVRDIITQKSIGAQILAHRATSIAVVGVLLLAFIFMKQLSDLKAISYVFMAFVMGFIGLMFAELYAKGGNPALGMSDVSSPIYDFRLITSFSILLFTYNNQFIVFSAYSSLKNKSN